MSNSERSSGVQRRTWLDNGKRAPTRLGVGLVAVRRKTQPNPTPTSTFLRPGRDLRNSPILTRLYGLRDRNSPDRLPSPTGPVTGRATGLPIGQVKTITNEDVKQRWTWNRPVPTTDEQNYMHDVVH